MISVAAGFVKTCPPVAEGSFIIWRFSGLKDVESSTELAQIIKRIRPLENQQRQQYDSADVGDEQQQAYAAEAASYTEAEHNNCPYRY